MKKLLGSITVALAIIVAAGAASAADKLKVGFIYVGPIGDHGWSYQHDQGRLALEKEFGDKVETVFVEKVAEGPDAERAITRLARQDAADHTEGEWRGEGRRATIICAYTGPHRTRSKGRV